MTGFYCGSMAEADKPNCVFLVLAAVLQLREKEDERTLDKNVNKAIY